jgi:hypothetical protein
MKYFPSILLTVTFFLSSCSVLNQLNLKPSALETVMALQEILNSSTFKAIKKLSKLHSDDPTQALPPEFKTVVDGLKTLGLGQDLDKITNQVSNISGIVLKESEGIITESIKEVDFGDAVAIVTGGKDAATQVLKNNMKMVVRRRYAEKLSVELAKTEADKYWPIAAGAYNMFAKNKVDASLSNFMADRAVDGLFLAIGHEEQEIRKDYKSLGISVVNKVFDYYTKNKSNPL